MTRIPLFLIIWLVLLGCGQSYESEGPTYDSLTYKVLFGEREAGYQNTWQDQDGSYHYTFEYNDRGRGPHFDERLTLSDSGLIISHEVKGHNYLKVPVDEKFNVNGNKAIWKSRSESGEETFDGSAYYVSLNGAPATREFMVQSLLKAENRQLKLLPNATARLSSFQTHNFGDTLQLQLAQITGLSFMPTYIWLDENQRFFATVSSWFTCIRDGHEGLRSELLDIQENIQKNYLKRLTDKLTSIPQGGIIIENVNIFDSKTATIQPNKTVLIGGNKIIRITPRTVDTPSDALVLDGTNKTLLPGLFDMHVHISKTDGILHLAAGVTSVRDMANALTLPDLKKAFNANQIIGPRIVTMCGFVDQAGPYAGPTGKIVTSVEEGIEGIKFYKEKGYDQIKLYSSIDPKWVNQLASTAHNLGMRVSGHIPAFMTAENAVINGYDEIQHVNMLALNFLPDTVDTRTPLRFSMVAEHTHALDVNSTPFKEFMQLLRGKGTVVDPTVSIFESMFTTKAGEPDPSFAPILDRLPVQVSRGYYAGGLPIPEGKEEQYKASYDKLLQIVYELYKNKVSIVPGTDAMAGFGLHRELENYVRVGIPAAEVLKMATYTSAQVTGVDRSLGSVEVGKLADMILVDGDPLKDISDIRKVEFTIKDGRAFNTKALYEAIQVEPYK